MSNINLGSAIQQARKKKNLTQDELSKQLHVSRQAISSWEINKSVPSVEIILNVCKVLDLDFNEIVAKNGVKAEDVISYQLKKGLRKYLFFGSIFFIFLILLVFTIFIVYNKNEFAVYNVYLDSNEFTLSNSILIKSKIKNYFRLGTLKPIIDIPKDTTYKIKLYTKTDEDQKIIFENEYDDDITLVEPYGYNEYFSKNIYEKENLYLDISYILKDKPYNFTYQLRFDLQFNSNHLFYNSDPNIDDDDENIIYNIDKLYIDKLIINGYEYDAENDYYIRTIKNGDFTYYNNSNKLEYTFDDSNTKIVIIYDFNDKYYEVKEFKQGNLIEYFNYKHPQNELICFTNDCSNYNDYLKKIIEEVELINQ